MSNAFLDIDDSFLNRNLLLENKQEDEISELLKSFEKPHVPFALVRPIPGGALCYTYDIAISTTYFNKCQKNKMFMIFTLDVMVEAVNNKFGKIYKSETSLLLKNRKVMGTLQQHKIEKREVRKTQFPKKLVQEVEDSPENSKKKPISASKNCSSIKNLNIPENPRYANNLDYIILQKPSKGQAEKLIGLFKVPTLISEDVSVDVGEDRIIVEVNEVNYLVDIFVPCSLDQEKVSAEMDSNLGILRLNMPLKC
ncbi:PIH1 domain-containing protein 1-like isoform X2 [Belonocnema kinseyi]|uniref:PIH1 domain-containing protein 1-like isoform X2 n=1 Tax=Belonocnema kinseyi TaxID=2817044 RepID=UPI00143CCCC9|nr:PIH1 domain-containing protein 1-like isoform X2 [Belonocnema kinseyi]